MPEAQPSHLPSELIVRASDGDQVALTVLLAYLRDRLLIHLKQRIPRDLQSRIDIDDLLQETQIQVFRHMGTFQVRGADSFYRWVATIGIRRLRNQIKALRAQKRGRAQTFSEGDQFSPDRSLSLLLECISGAENTPSRHASRNEACDALSAALTHLPDHYREAVRLVCLEGRSVSEAARIMGRTDRAIHNLCHKAKEQLHRAMGSTSRFFSRP